jgi:hypothetical protein
MLIEKNERKDLSTYECRFNDVDDRLEIKVTKFDLIKKIGQIDRDNLIKGCWNI